MGAYQTKRKDFPPPPRRRKLKKPVVCDYTPNASGRRPKSSQSWREVIMVTMGQMGKSSTSYDEFDARADKVQHLPRWQSKWEVDMRPAPGSDTKSNLRGWTSMPLPTTTEDAVTANKTSPRNKPNGADRRGKRRSSRMHQFEHRKSDTSVLPDVEETDNFERFSWKSSKVDCMKMLHKSDGKTMNTLHQACRMWHLDNKRANKTWFLSQDSNMKLENQIVEKKTHAKKTQQVFVATKSKGRYSREEQAL